MAVAAEADINAVLELLDGWNDDRRRLTIAAVQQQVSGGNANANPEVRVSVGGAHVEGANVVLETTSSRRLKIFSGKDVPAGGELQYSTWRLQAKQLVDSDKSESEKRRILIDSVVAPAVENLSPLIECGGTAKDMLDLLDGVYGSVVDPYELKAQIHSCIQDKSELASKYLQRLYQKVNEARRQGALDAQEVDQVLLKQFMYGLHDEELILQLGLKNPLPFTELIQKVRKEEARRSRRKVNSGNSSASKDAKCNNMDVTTVPDDDPMAAAIRSIQDKLEAQQLALQSFQQQFSGAQGNTPRSGTTPPTSDSQQPKRRKAKPKSDSDTKVNEFKGWCYNCGLDGHKKSTCRLPSNPQKVMERLQARGSRSKSSKHDLN